MAAATVEIVAAAITNREATTVMVAVAMAVDAMVAIVTRDRENRGGRDREQRGERNSY